MKRILGFGVAALVTIILSIPAFADEQDTATANLEGNKVTDYRGLKFSVPADWPIEKVGNTIGPIPMEDYMSRKFAAQDVRLKKQEEKITALEKRIETLERRRSLNA